MAVRAGPVMPSGAFTAADDLAIRVHALDTAVAGSAIGDVGRAAQAQVVQFGRMNAAAMQNATMLQRLGPMNRDMGRNMGMSANMVGEFAYQMSAVIPSMRGFGMQMVMAGGTAVQLGGMLGPVGVIIGALTAAIPLLVMAFDDEVDAVDAAKEGAKQFEASLVEVAGAAVGTTETIGNLARQFVDTGTAALGAAENVRTAAERIRSIEGAMRQAREDQALLRGVMGGTETTETQQAALADARLELEGLRRQQRAAISGDDIPNFGDLGFEERVAFLQRVNAAVEEQERLIDRLEDRTSGRGPTAPTGRIEPTSGTTELTYVMWRGRSMLPAEIEAEKAREREAAARGRRQGGAGGGESAARRREAEMARQMLREMDESFQFEMNMFLEGNLDEVPERVMEAFRRSAERRAEGLARAINEEFERQEREAERADDEVTRMMRDTEREMEQEREQADRRMRERSEELAKAMREWRDDSVDSIRDVIAAFHEYNATAEESLGVQLTTMDMMTRAAEVTGQSILDAIGGAAKSAFEENVNAWLDGEQSIMQAANNIAKGIVNALVKRSVVEAAVEGAAALASLAMYNFPAAAAHGVAAAAWAGVAGVAGAVGLATGAVGGGGKSRGGGSATRPAERQAAAGGSSSSLQMVINVNAPVDNPVAMGTWLAGHIREARRVQPGLEI